MGFNPNPRGAGIYGGDLAAAGSTATPQQPPHNCDAVAVINGEQFPCHSHKGMVHNFAADLPDPCEAPFCRLPKGHRTLHDIPAGRPDYVRMERR